jgi:MYXO-CTERM domain-containing protein
VDVEARARVALARVSPFAAARAASLVATTTDRFGDGEAIVHFEQAHHGLPVIGRGAAVRLAPSGEALLTAIDLEEDLPSSVTPALGAAAAAAVASRVATGLATADDAHLVVWPLIGGGSRLAYAILPRLPAGLPMAPRVIVDAENGKILEARNLVQFAKASMYRSNPTKSPQLELLDLALAPTGTKLTNDFVTSFNCIDNKTVRALNISGFKANVHVCDIQQVATADANGDFLYVPHDIAGTPESKNDEFAEVSMYYHASKAYAFFRGLQGVADAQVVVDKPLRVVANLQLPAGISSGNFATAADPNTALEPFQNAFFSPAGGGLGAIFSQLYGLKGGALWFGQGPMRDYAYDGDVVYHEFTHAVVDATIRLGAWHVDARGAVDAPGAMNEGLADYFSSAITGDPDVGEYASKDISQNSGVIRTLANQDACPSAVLGEVHFDSTLFSGALWEARASLADADRTPYDAALYKALRTNPGRGDLGYDDLAKLFLATLTTDLPAGATALEAAMKARGVLPSCDRVVEPKAGHVKAIDTSVGGFTSPGLQSIAFGELAPGLIQVHTAVGPADATLTVSFTTRKGGGGGNPLGGSATPFAPVVLAKFGKAITWTPNRGQGTHDADQAVVPEAGVRQTAAFVVPAGATDVWVQIANKGDSDGNYDDVVLDLAPAAVTPPGADTAGADAGPTAPAQADTGCGCSTPGQASGGGAPLAGLVAGLVLAIGGLRRRRA